MIALYYITLFRIAHCNVCGCMQERPYCYNYWCEPSTQCYNSINGLVLFVPNSVILQLGLKCNAAFSAAELEGLEPPLAHPPCALSSSRMKRFNDRSQPSMAAVFGKKRSAGESMDEKRSAICVLLCMAQYSISAPFCHCKFETYVLKLICSLMYKLVAGQQRDQPVAVSQSRHQLVKGPPQSMCPCQLPQMM